MSSEENIEFSAIVPVYNEEGSLPELYEQLTDAFVSMGRTYEIIFINDGSKDGSLKHLLSFEEKDLNVKVIDFYSNYGKSAAYTAAFQHCSGKYIFTLDSDLQDVPSEMPKLLAKIEEGNDLVVGWKQKRLNNEPIKKIPSFFYNGVKRMLFGLSLHDSNSGFRCFKKEITYSINLYGDRYRFIPELAHLCGFKVTEAATEHRQRSYGVSKYGASRFLTGLMDLLSVRYLSKFSTKPLHFFGFLAFSSIFLGGALEFYVLIQKILLASHFQTHIAAIIIGALFIILGALFLSIGLIGEMLSTHNKVSEFTIKTKKGFANN